MTETTPLPEAAVVPMPGARIETDLFCPHCGYNLFSLAVVRDARLDILLVRCPECGRFHPAGAASFAGRVWLERLGKIAVAWWVFFLIGVMLIHFLMMVGFGEAYLEEFTHYQEITATVPLAGGGHTTHTSYVRVVGPSYNPERATEALVSHVLLVGVLVGIGLSLGGFGAVFLWHVKAPWNQLALLWPVASVGLAFVIVLADASRWEGLFNWIAWQLALVLLMELMGMELGLLFGRPVARGMLRLLLPRRLLQHLSFLWEVDGKKVPPLKA